MTMSKKRILIIAGAAVAGWLLWSWWRDRNPPVAGLAADAAKAAG